MMVEKNTNFRCHSDRKLPALYSNLVHHNINISYSITSHYIYEYLDIER